MKRTKELSLCAVLLSLALALSYAERFLPLQLLVPLPGVKLGLANIVTMVTLYLLKTRHAFAILILRCFLTSVFGGGITGFAFSLCGGLLATTVMAVSKNAPCFSVFGVSILGAAAHNIGQVLAAMVLMHSVYIGAYLPYLLLISVFTGIATGGACTGVLRIFSFSQRGKWAI